MGNFWSHSNSASDPDNSSTSEYYFFPPIVGNRFFGSTFIMGNDKFEMSDPESYLFGDVYDLNYLGGKPNPFPYAAPFPNEPMQMLKSLINIRKETLKLINPDENDLTDPTYTIEFIFDSDVDCAITVYFLCKEDISTQGIKYIPKELTFRSETFHYKAGIGQLFSHTSPIFNPQNYNISDLLYRIYENEKGEFDPSALYPVVINCVAEEGDEPRQCHSLIAVIEKVYDHIFCLKPLKQKIFIDGLTYVLQEIYGIENKVDKTEKNSSGGRCSREDENDKSFECVICMSDLRDTLILPCRHLSLCQNCADALRYQANNCPICRAPFRALLQIKAVKRSSTNNPATANTATATTTSAAAAGPNSAIILSDSLNDVTVDIPVGFETIPLIEALNGIRTSQSNMGDRINLSEKITIDQSEQQVVNQPKENEGKIVEKLCEDMTMITKNFQEKDDGDNKLTNDEPNDNRDKESMNSIKGEDCDQASASSSSSSSSTNTQENISLLSKVETPATTLSKQQSQKE